MPRGNMKLRRRSTGRDERRGERQLSPDEEHGQKTAATAQTITPGDSSPSMGPMLSTSMAAVTAPARLQLPTQSMPCPGVLFGRALAGPPARPSTRSRARPPRRGRSSAATTRGDDQQRPAVPRTGRATRGTGSPANPASPRAPGPPAPTSDHHPSALTRSSRSKSCRISAIEAVPVAAPCTPSSARREQEHPDSRAPSP